MVDDGGVLPLTTDAFTGFLLMTIVSGISIIAAQVLSTYLTYKMFIPPVDWKKHLFKDVWKSYELERWFFLGSFINVMIYIFVDEFQDISVPIVIGCGVAIVSTSSMYFWPPTALTQDIVRLEQEFDQKKRKNSHNMELRSHSKKQ